MKTLDALLEDQNEICEKVEVRVYEQTKEKAEIVANKRKMSSLLQEAQAKQLKHIQESNLIM